MIGSEGMEIDTDKVISVNEMTPSANVDELRKFLGLINLLTNSSLMHKRF